MAKATKICKICGKEYDCCRTSITNTGIFHWRDVACCEEHGKQYFAKIIASRAGDVEEAVAESTVAEDGKDVDVPTIEAIEAPEETLDIADDEDDEIEEPEFDEDDEDELTIETT